MQSTGNTILITGGASGIGLALARRFHSRRNRIILTGRDPHKLARAAASLPGAFTFPSDISDPASVDTLCDYIATGHPGLNLLVNNAGVQYAYDFQTTPDIVSNIAAETAINFTAPLQLTARLLPQLSRQPAAAVVFVSSALYIAPKRSAPVYCATKSAIHTFAKALRYQLEGSPVKVFDIIPPLVDTAMTANRSSGKISPDQLAAIFLRLFENEVYEQHIGKARLLKLLSRLSPALAERILRNG
ncbi:SDR family NAD(P)-dependent oxidoreductase [Chitinophaga sp.]|uniref:SDR family oxidoreductase n=1 Tax=Chitinophaga sp. TaxID=1869181 RepID=UPI00261EB316|nr:SDR family NAD(P)-dependent oxidoreductase [uncultured Chitinophaga sp.]